MVPNELKYTSDHEWIKVDGTTGTIGVTDFAQGELGDVVFIDIAEDLAELKSGESFGTIEAVKTVSDLFAPCDGKVIEINTQLADDPQKVNSDPYGKGWLIKIEITDTSQLESLLDAEAYKTQIGE